jgi:hypothetical protein
MIELTNGHLTGDRDVPILAASGLLISDYPRGVREA